MIHLAGPDCLLDPCLTPGESPQPLRLVAPRKGTMSEHRREIAGSVVEKAHAEIGHYLRWQARCYDDGERRRVQIWDAIEISVACDGTDLQGRYLDCEPDAGRFVGRADLTRPIAGNAFVFAFMPLVRRAARDQRLDPRTLAGPTGDWIRDAIRRAFRDLVDWRRLRRSVLEFLRPDPLVYSLTQRVFGGYRASIDAFNWVARHQRELSLVAIEHPRLLPFLQHLEGKEGALVPQFDQWMAAAGLTPSARRKLERWGYDPFAHARQLPYVVDEGEPIARYANLLDRLQVMDEPPEMFTQLASVHSPGAPEWFHRALLAEIVRLSDEDPGYPCPDAFEHALPWLASKPPAPDANQARAGWAWIDAQVSRFEIATDESTRTPWPAPCEAFEMGALRVVPVRSRPDLVEEARVLRNCLDTLAGDCADGLVAVFSIRTLDGRRVGCFAMQPLPAPACWEVFQVVGPANREATEEMAMVAGETLRRAVTSHREEQPSSRPLPREREHSTYVGAQPRRLGQ